MGSDWAEWEKGSPGVSNGLETEKNHALQMMADALVKLCPNLGSKPKDLDLERKKGYQSFIGSFNAE